MKQRAVSAQLAILTRCATILMAFGSLTFGCRHAGEGHGAEPVDGLRVLSPLDGCSIKHGPIYVIARAASDTVEPPLLELDGEAARWQTFEPPVFAADMPAGDGLHTVRIGERTFRVMVGDPPKEEENDWPRSNSHPRPGKGSRDCDACHETASADGRIRLGPLTGYTKCRPCHNEKQFAKAHRRPPKPDDSCADCHAIHGTTRKHLLADRRD